jgi:hypothetical protein
MMRHDNDRKKSPVIIFNIIGPAGPQWWSLRPEIDIAISQSDTVLSSFIAFHSPPLFLFIYSLGSRHTIMSWQC